MAWQTVEADDAIMCKLLLRDDGKLLGWIIRFNEEGPTHAWTPLGRIGPVSARLYDGEHEGARCAARDVVERAVEVGPLRPAAHGGSGRRQRATLIDVTTRRRNNH